MVKVQLVGCSPDSITFILDLIHENFDVIDVGIYNNLDDFKPINFSIKNYNVKIEGNDFFPEPSKGVFFGVTGPFNKLNVFKHFEKMAGLQREQFFTLKAKTSYVAESTRLSCGVLIDTGVIVSSQSSIEFGVSIKRGAIIGHHNIIGEFCDINPGVVTSGKVTIGKGCILGTGCVLTDNITVGENTIIGIGSVVTKSIPSNVIAYGNPCKVIRPNSIVHF